MAVVAVASIAGAAAAQQAVPAPVERRDAAVELASQQIGRALFLRCLCANDDLTFDAQGKLATGGARNVAVDRVDWTLAGVDIRSVERASTNLVELTGVRVALRFTSDRHEFERHPQKDEEVRITVRDSGDTKAFAAALAAIFAQGIDVPLQRSLPAYWQHYFDPGMPWPAGSPDALTGQTVLSGGAPDKVASGQAPANPAMNMAGRADTTPLADRDRIRGSTVVRFVVDTDGIPRRIALQTPIGYGMDARAIAVVAAMRFTPSTLNGSAVPVSTNVRVDFVQAPATKQPVSNR